MTSQVIAHVFRVGPHEDLKEALLEFAKKNNIAAGFILTCVGSLERFNLRFANQKEGSSREGFFEILALSGTLSNEAAHLHLSIADSAGQVCGGHLLTGNQVYTTAEIVIGELPALVFRREEDPTYGFLELKVFPHGDDE